jgi:hypothetical protein
VRSLLLFFPFVALSSAKAPNTTNRRGKKRKKRGRGVPSREREKRSLKKVAFFCENEECERERENYARLGGTRKISVLLLNLFRKVVSNSPHSTKHKRTNKQTQTSFAKDAGGRKRREKGGKPKTDTNTDSE